MVLKKYYGLKLEIAQFNESDCVRTSLPDEALITDKQGSSLERWFFGEGGGN